MSEVTETRPHLPARLGKAIGGIDANDDLSEGVGGGFAVISFRGSKWRVKHAKEEQLITNKDGEAAASIQVVILKANRHISKNFYPGQYQEGSNDNPTCWSVDGIKPDAAVPQPVSPQCVSCPNNVFGSRVTEQGKKAKACQDSRRLAVVPIQDLANEVYGGPMLLRIPPASLSDLATFGKEMKNKGFPYNTIVTRIGFDNDVSYPKLVFKPMRPLNAKEEETILELLNQEEWGGKIDTVLAKASELIPQPVAPAAPPPAQQQAAPTEKPAPAAPPKQADPFAFEMDEPAPAPAPVAKQPAASKPRAVATPAKKATAAAAQPAPASAPVTSEAELDNEIEDILSKLDAVD